MKDSSLKIGRFGWAVVASGVILVLLGGIAWLAQGYGARTSDKAGDSAGSMSAEKFGDRVRNYILSNPEVILEATQRLRAQRQALERRQAEELLQARRQEIFRDPMSPIGGNPDGDVTIVEFFDYNCPYCRQSAPILAKSEERDSGLRIIYKEFPILGSNSVFAAKAALAAHRQNRYLPFHRALMETKRRLDPPAVLEVAAQVGLDVDRLKTDMKDPAIAKAIEQNRTLAASLKITGTPGFIIGDKIVRGAVDLRTLQTLIRQARATN